MGRRDILELVDQHPDIVDQITHLENNHQNVLDNAEKVWSNIQRFDYQIKEYLLDMQILSDWSLAYRKKVTLTGPLSLIKIQFK